MRRPLVSVVSAHVRERLVFNFAVDPAAMANAVVCDWLEPQVIDGVAIASFCMLWMTRVTPRGWPSILMPAQVSCAIRFGVISRNTGEAGVYVVDRCTDSTLGSLATRLGCPGFHPLVRISDSTGSPRRIEVVRGRAILMSLEVSNPCDDNGVFGSLNAFERFMSEGVRSFTLAATRDAINVVDLKKEETRFKPHEAHAVDAAAIRDLFGDGYRLDSAYRATDARYEWTFVEQRPLTLSPFGHAA